MSITITAEQRDALYDQILDRLSGIGDIGDGNGSPVALTTPPQVLRGVLPRLRELAIDHTAGLEPEWAEAHEIKERNRLVSEACETVMAGLESSAAGTRG